MDPNAGRTMTAEARPGWRSAGAVAGLIFAWLAATAGLRPLMLPDEGRYVGVAWEMLRSGDWLTPTLNGLPYFHKPPLFYWITAAAMSLFGTHEWAARAAPLLGAWLGALAMFLFARRWSNPRTARLALAALLAQPLFYVGGQFANLDMLVAGIISATILLFADALLRSDAGLPFQRSLAAAWAMAALGVLAKGLIGIVIPALVILALLLLRRGRGWRAFVGWPGPLLFAALAAPWFVAMESRFAGFLDYFFVVQHFKRFAAGGFNNPQPFWFYPALLLVFTLPWLPSLWRLGRRGRELDPAGGALRQLMVAWVAVVVVFFSLPQSKLVGYVLPALPPLAFLVADGLANLGLPSARARRLWWGGIVGAALLSLGTVFGLTAHPRASSRELAAVLAAERSAGEPVFLLNRYDFDLPFYARLRTPVLVALDWPRTQSHSRDDWRKELADAGRFASAAADATLLDRAALADAICRHPVSWVVGAADAGAGYPGYAFLALAPVAFTGRQTSLWRVDSTAPGIAGRLGCAAGIGGALAAR